MLASVVFEDPRGVPKSLAASLGDAMVLSCEKFRTTRSEAVYTNGTFKVDVGFLRCGHEFSSFTVNSQTGRITVKLPCDPEVYVFNISLAWCMA